MVIARDWLLLVWYSALHLPKMIVIDKLHKIESSSMSWWMQLSCAVRKKKIDREKPWCFVVVGVKGFSVKSVILAVIYKSWLYETCHNQSLITTTTVVVHHSPCRMIFNLFWAPPLISDFNTNWIYNTHHLNDWRLFYERYCLFYSLTFLYHVHPPCPIDMWTHFCSWYSCCEIFTSCNMCRFVHTASSIFCLDSKRSLGSGPNPSMFASAHDVQVCCNISFWMEAG